MNVEILGVFATAELANAYTRRWLAARLPRACYRYGEGEVRRGDGGIRVDVVTERRDGSLLVDVERHFVVCGGGEGGGGGGGGGGVGFSRATGGGGGGVG